MSAESTTLQNRVLLAASHDAPGANRDPEPNFENDLEEHRLRVELDALRQQVAESAETQKLRVSYARHLFWLVCAWLLCVVVAVGLAGFKTSGFILSDAVLIAFITTTTINVVGLFFVVAKWLFPSKGNGSESAS